MAPVPAGKRVRRAADISVLQKTSDSLQTLKQTVAAAKETPQERHFERIAEQIVDIPVPEMTPNF